MTSSDFALVLRWLLPLWLLGWLVLPFSRRIFANLPDGGLAAGRLLALVLLSLVAFWGASMHVLSLQLAPIWMICAPLLAAISWKNADFRAWAKENRRALVFSDLVFLAAFGFFLWVRLRHPEAHDLEKPMDMALISAAMRADFLPFENPWFSGHLFTNYYYFGPLMGALMANCFKTPPYLAYNLIQPAFCAFFLSVLWSIGAALSGSKRLGFAAMLLVGVGGHLEPLKQIGAQKSLWPLDWWKTSRVIPNTINEYPLFTLAIGDLHAHFYALSLAALWFCLCWALWTPSFRRQTVVLILGGLILGVFLLTNTWDAPLYGLLFLMAALWALPKSKKWLAFVPFPLAIFTALPYLLKFKSQVSGAVWNPWIPEFKSFFLLWGAWLALGFWAFSLKPWREEKQLPAPNFRLLLTFVGVLALVAPFVFYIKGVFGDGDLRHQDTVFKFGLQAWLLGGLGVACEVLTRLRVVLAEKNVPIRAASWGTAIFAAAILFLAPICVVWTRTTRDGTGPLSLNAMRYLPEDEQKGIEWLRKNAKAGDVVLEVVGQTRDGNPGGDFDANFGRVSAFSGVPTPLGWSQHVAGWGGDWAEIQQRQNLLNGQLSFIPVDFSTKANFLFWGDLENKIFGAVTHSSRPPILAVKTYKWRPVFKTSEFASNSCTIFEQKRLK